jgi:hypothetical protein
MSSNRLNFIEKLKRKDSLIGGKDRDTPVVGKLLQSFLLSKWKELQTRKQKLNYEEEGILISYKLIFLLGIPGAVQLIGELTKPPVDKLRLGNHGLNPNSNSHTKHRQGIFLTKRINIKKVKHEEENNENIRDVEVRI